MLEFLQVYFSSEVASFFEESIVGTMDAIKLHLGSFDVDETVGSQLS